MFNPIFGRRIGACCVAVVALGVAACSSDSESTVAPVAQTVTVVGTESAESRILIDIYARALENGGFRVARRAAVADLAGGYKALNSGAADLFVARTGELLAYLAENEPAAASTSTTAVATTTTIAQTTTSLVATTVAATSTSEAPTDDTPDGTTDDTTDESTGGSTDTTTVDGSSTTSAVVESTTTTISTAGQASAISLNLQSNLIGEILPDTLQIGAASNSEDKPVIACNATTSVGLSLLSDLAEVSEDLRIAATAEFETGEPFGLPGFEEVYGAGFGEFIPVEADKVAGAFVPEPPAEDTTSTTSTTIADPATAGDSTTTTVAAPIETDADCGAFASSLDTTITAEMVVLDDDQNWVRNNGVVPLLTAAAYTPGVSQVVDQVSQALNTADLREMIRQVDDGAAPSTVAGQWLQLTGLTGS